MDLLDIILISLGVSVDAFSVSIGGSLCDRTGKVFRNAFRAGLYFGVFQAVMPVIGFFTAGFCTAAVEGFSNWAAFLLLAAVGGKMIFDGIKESLQKESEKECPLYDFFGWGALFLPAVATSLDALAVGAGFCFAGKNIWLACLFMGGVTAVISACGVFIGRFIGKFACEHLMQILGGTAIALVGVKILFF